MKPETKVDEKASQVMVDGREICYNKYEYYMLNKPKGFVSATNDREHKTVIDIIQSSHKKDLFPVGRLDKDTEGLLLITNDGKLANELLAPGKHVDKTYYARISGRVTEAEIEKFREGLDIGDEKLTAPACLRILEAGEESEIEITITEGRYHQIKRMFEAVGMKVVYLKRLSMGNLLLDPSLKNGEYRRLTEEEIACLRKRNDMA